MSKTERRPRLTTARKFELYLATRSADAPLGEILRQYGVHLDDLRAIERVVESSALAGLKAQSRHGRQPTSKKSWPRRREPWRSWVCRLPCLKKKIVPSHVPDPRPKAPAGGTPSDSGHAKCWACRHAPFSVGRLRSSLFPPWSPRCRL